MRSTRDNEVVVVLGDLFRGLARLPDVVQEKLRCRQRLRLASLCKVIPSPTLRVTVTVANPASY